MKNVGIVSLYTIVDYNSSYRHKSYIIHFSLLIIH